MADGFFGYYLENLMSIGLSNSKKEILFQVQLAVSN